VAPTDPLPIVHYVAKAGWRSLDVMLWGLIPNWVKDIKIGFSTLNARAEEVDTKPAFSEAFQQRRCLVTLDSFYEWKKTAARKQPCAIALADRRLMALADLSETWRSPADERVRSFTIIIKTLNESCAELHNRMTVFLKLVVSLEAGY
jgi:putative SOS response-associated peptidase YedK